MTLPFTADAMLFRARQFARNYDAPSGSSVVGLVYLEPILAAILGLTIFAVVFVRIASLSRWLRANAA